MLKSFRPTDEQTPCVRKQNLNRHLQVVEVHGCYLLPVFMSLSIKKSLIPLCHKVTKRFFDQECLRTTFMGYLRY